MGYIITPDEMRALEDRAVSKGITQESLMEEAGKQIGQVISSFVKERAYTQKALIVAGKGNNGGDGYVIARTLLQQGFSVTVWQLYPIDPNSLIRKQRRRFEARGGKVTDIQNDSPELPKEGVIVDAIFGTGFTGTPEPRIQGIIQKINSAHIPVISVDIPSGVNAGTGDISECAICAALTVAVEFPKIGFFLKSAYNHIGALKTCSIGLQPFVDASKMACTVVEKEAARALLPHVVRNRHKYQAGHVVGLAGSHGMAGASLLASYSALKAGAGIVHLLHPDEYTNEFTGVPLEIVRVPYLKANSETVVQTLQKATSCFIGPGLGKNDALYEAVMPVCTDKPCVFDADALTWMAKKWPKGNGLGPLPQAILTPHLGELERLFSVESKEGITLELLAKCQEFAGINATHLVLKGAPTFLFSPNKLPQAVLNGDPGMATAGSGDVLTGIVAALLAQKLTPDAAMSLGVYLHASAGSHAACDETSYSMTASSIITHLSNAFKELLSKG